MTDRKLLSVSWAKVSVAERSLSQVSGDIYLQSQFGGFARVKLSSESQKALEVLKSWAGAHLGDHRPFFVRHRGSNKNMSLYWVRELRRLRDQGVPWDRSLEAYLETLSNFESWGAPPEKARKVLRALTGTIELRPSAYIWKEFQGFLRENQDLKREKSIPSDPLLVALHQMKLDSNCKKSWFSSIKRAVTEIRQRLPFPKTPSIRLWRSVVLSPTSPGLKVSLNAWRFFREKVHQYTDLNLPSAVQLGLTDILDSSKPRRRKKKRPQQSKRRKTSKKIKTAAKSSPPTAIELGVQGLSDRNYSKKMHTLIQEKGVHTLRKSSPRVKLGRKRTPSTRAPQSPAVPKSSAVPRPLRKAHNVQAIRGEHNIQVPKSPPQIVSLSTETPTRTEVPRHAEVPRNAEVPSHVEVPIGAVGSSKELQKTGPEQIGIPIGSGEKAQPSKEPKLPELSEELIECIVGLFGEDIRGVDMASRCKWGDISWDREGNVTIAIPGDPELRRGPEGIPLLALLKRYCTEEDHVVSTYPVIPTTTEGQEHFTFNELLAIFRRSGRILKPLDPPRKTSKREYGRP